MTKKERAAARGHKDERAERQRRRAIAWRDFGVSPETLSKLRRAALRNMTGQLAGVRTRNPVNPAEIELNLESIGGEGLATMVEMGGREIQRIAALPYESLILDYPELENDDEINVGWYK